MVVGHFENFFNLIKREKSIMSIKKEMGPPVFFNRLRIEEITKECKRLSKIKTEDPGFAKPYLNIIDSLKTIKERNFPNNGVISINLEG